MLERILSRGLAALLLLSSVTLAAATAPTPSPSPRPTISPTAAASSAPLGQLPIVVIYPFEVQTGADARIGTAIAQILSEEMAAAGGISVTAVPQGVKRADFLDNAHAAHADFYISGYVTPVGDSAAVVEQVVSVASGVILFSQTAQVTSVADVASQSLLARAQILALLGRNTEGVAPQQAGTPAPTSTNGAQVPIKGIGSIVDSVFKRHSSQHTPTPGPTTKPSRGVIVAPVTAPSSAFAATDLSGALRELYLALNLHYTVQLTAITTNVATTSDSICGPNRNNTIATGTLAQPAAHHGKAQVSFTLLVYTCFGAVLDHEVGTGSSIKSAVDAAVTAYATAHPDNS
jgi:hypothetical protein